MALLEHGEKELIIDAIDVTKEGFNAENAKHIIKETPAVKLLEARALEKAWDNYINAQNTDTFNAHNGNGRKDSKEALEQAKEIKDLVTGRMNELSAKELHAHGHSGKPSEGTGAVYVAQKRVAQLSQNSGMAAGQG